MPQASVSPMQGGGGGRAPSSPHGGCSSQNGGPSSVLPDPVHYSRRHLFWTRMCSRAPRCCRGSRFFLTLFPNNYAPPPRPPQALWLCPQREEPGSGDRRVQTNFYYHSAERVWARSLRGKRHRTRERQLEKRSRDGLPGAGARGCGRLSRGSEAGSVLSLHPTHTCGTLTHSQTVLSSRLRIRGDVGGTVPTRTVLLKTDALGRECSRVVPRAGLPSGTTSVSAAPGGQGGTWDPLPLPGHFLT